MSETSFACSRESAHTIVFLTNKPWFGSQVKYTRPFSSPLFLPSGLSSSMPTHSPCATSVGPMYRTMPDLPNAYATRQPTVTSMMKSRGNEQGKVPVLNRW